jgi:hypothetical protein
VPQDRAGEPKDAPPKEAEASPPQAPPPDQTDLLIERGAAYLVGLGPKLRRKAINFAFDWVGIAVFLLIVFALFKYVIPDQGVLRNFQSQLYNTVGNIKPMGLLNYIGEFFIIITTPVKYTFDAFFSIVAWLYSGAVSIFEPLMSPAIFPFFRLLINVVIGLIMFWPVIIFAFVFVAFLAVTILASPVILPIIVLMKGTALEVVLVFLIFLPLLWIGLRDFKPIKALASVSSLQDLGAFVFVLGIWPFFALGIATLFYFLVKLAMWLAAWSVGELIPLAPTAVAAGGVAAFCIQCTVKTTVKTIEDSVAKRVTYALRKAVWNMIRPGPH